MGKVSIIASLVVGFVVISIICLSVGLIYRNKKAKVDTPATEIIWSFHLENDSDLKLKGNLDVIDVNILKTEDYSVGAYNANVNSIEHEFPTAKLTGWTHTYQEPLMIQKFVVESNEVNFLKVEPISGFTVFNNQDTGDFVTIWHDEEFHHYSPKGQLLSIGPFPFANGDDSINPNDLEIPTKISKPESEVDSTTDTELDSDLDATYMIKEPEVEPDIELDSDLDATYMIKEPEPKPLLNNMYPDVLTTGWTLDELDKSKKPDDVSFDTASGFPSGWHDNSDIVKEPEPKPLLNNMYPDVLTTGWTLDELDKSKKPDDVSFDTAAGFPSGWHDNIDIVEVPETFVNILPQMNLTKEDLVFDLSVITLATEETPYKIIQGDDELNIKKHKVDDVFKKYSCSVTNDRTFKPQIRHFLSNFELKCENVSEFELYVGEYDEPLCIRLKDQTGFKTYVHRGNNKWESLNVQELNTNILDEQYLLLRDDITMIDFSKKSGSYKFGNYKVEVTEPSASLPESDPSSSDTNLYPGFKAYIHTIYNDTGSSVDFTSVRVHRFKYGELSLTGFMRNFLIRKLYVYFWEPELTKPIYIRMFAHLGFLNYFGYPHYNLQTDTSMFTYYLTLANFEVNNVLAINLSRHDSYDFEGGISPYPTRNQLTVKRQEDSPLKPFRRCVHTLTVDGVNKPFSILKFINEPNLSVDQTKVSSLEAYYHNKHLNKPLLVILNGSVRQKFYKLEDNGYVSMDNLIVDLKNTLKYLVYHNYKYLKIDVSKMTNYHYTGESNTSSLPDANIKVSVDEVQLSEFFKFTHSLKLDNIQSKFRLIALDGADITFDDPELTSVDSYFLTKDKPIPLIVVLRGAVDVAYVYKRKRYLREQIDTSNPLDVLRRLAHQNFDSLYLKLDQTSSYYDQQQDGFSVTVSNVYTSHQGYKHYVHTFETPNEPLKKYNNVIFLNANNYFHLKIDESHYIKANVYIDNNNFPSIVSLIDDKGTTCNFIFHDNVYKKAKDDSVNTKLSSGSQT
ncbi:uncharacterized protein TA18870 [Theileria annulata]|uniref:Uncharacterized protein n=1 Tax=Theileria annulata TaxID=5874 RepID=Q4UFW7_THEAN|nr:uncharacterized protein TA18870 [Theileria annulata]CAI74022.1 hypothetical protein TA18870 [Theileria annulata]|eukprot:XP_954702.1 hypothetical protein TA18870 [Theileria annulata]